MEILIRTLQFVASLSILILVHEMGHFFAAKLFKTRVEKFYLFFNPWFALFKFKYKDTEYGLGWLPLGGYCKISGMIDESMDKEQMKEEPKPYEFRSKPAWQRLIIIVGGVAVNLLMAIFIYIFMLYFTGESYLSNSAVNQIACDSIAKKIGFETGDKILTINNKVVDDFYKIPKLMSLEKNVTVQVKRNNKIENINITEDKVASIINSESISFLMPRIPFEIADFVDNSAGKKGGLLANDKLIGINDIKTQYFDEFKTELQKHKNEQIDIKLIRNKDTMKIAMTVPKEGLLGIVPKDMSNYYKLTTINYNFFEAIGAGTVLAYNKVTDYFKSMKLIFSQKVQGYKKVGGFIAIGKLFPAQWDWIRFWELTAFLSVILAVMNILPIPALDGGYVIFILYEIITRRKPSDKFMEYAQVTGMVLLLSLLVYANANDIIKLFTN